ncbi:hypothetical protein JL720_17304 [Aureococcus anophagefferens]|nr:hypothetical protein JL720_17304 [Aureococcus anophagefferens]
MYKRLRKEAAEARRSTDPDLLLCPSEDNLMDWRAWVRGPEGTPFERGVFELEIKACGQYPLAPPTVRMVTPIFHPNIHGVSGEICLDILKQEWSPAWTLASACTAIRALLSAPNPDSPLNCDAGNVMRAGDMDGFRATARHVVAPSTVRAMAQRSSVFGDGMMRDTRIDEDDDFATLYGDGAGDAVEHSGWRTSDAPASLAACDGDFDEELTGPASLETAGEMEDDADDYGFRDDGARRRRRRRRQAAASPSSEVARADAREYGARAPRSASSTATRTSRARICTARGRETEAFEDGRPRRVAAPALRGRARAPRRRGDVAAAGPGAAHGGAGPARVRRRVRILAPRRAAAPRVRPLARGRRGARHGRQAAADDDPAPAPTRAGRPPLPPPPPLARPAGDDEPPEAWVSDSPLDTPGADDFADPLFRGRASAVVGRGSQRRARWHAAKPLALAGTARLKSRPHAVLSLCLPLERLWALTRDFGVAPALASYAYLMQLAHDVLHSKRMRTDVGRVDPDANALDRDQFANVLARLALHAAPPDDLADPPHTVAHAVDRMLVAMECSGGLAKIGLHTKRFQLTTAKRTAAAGSRPVREPDPRSPRSP